MSLVPERRKRYPLARAGWYFVREYELLSLCERVTPHVSSDLSMRIVSWSGSGDGCGVCCGGGCCWSVNMGVFAVGGVAAGPDGSGDGTGRGVDPGVVVDGPFWVDCWLKALSWSGEDGSLRDRPGFVLTQTIPNSTLMALLRLY